MQWSIARSKERSGKDELGTRAVPLLLDAPHLLRQPLDDGMRVRHARLELLNPLVHVPPPARVRARAPVRLRDDEARGDREQEALGERVRAVLDRPADACSVTALRAVFFTRAVGWGWGRTCSR